MNTINLIPKNSINPFDLFRKSPIQKLEAEETKILSAIEGLTYAHFCMELELKTVRDKIAFFKSKG